MLNGDSDPVGSTDPVSSSTRSCSVKPMMEIESGKSECSLRARWIRKRSPSSHSMSAVPWTTTPGREGCVASVVQEPTNRPNDSNARSPVMLFSAGLVLEAPLQLAEYLRLDHARDLLFDGPRFRFAARVELDSVAGSRDAFDDEPVQGFGSFDVLQPPFAERMNRDAIGQVWSDERAGRFRKQDLPAAAHRRNPGGAHDVHSRVPLVAHGGLTRVQAHPNADLFFFGPRVTCQRSLRRYRRRDGVAGSGERVEERVTLGVDLAAVPSRECFAHDPTMLRENGRKRALPETLQQIGASLDVAEQERHGAGVEVHRSRIGQREESNERGGAPWLSKPSCSI